MTDPFACTHCGQLNSYQAIKNGEEACCVRCSSVLYRQRKYMLDACLALAVTGLILFVMANAFPLIALKAQGVTQELTIWKATAAFWEQDYYWLSALLALNLIIFPLFELLGLLWVLLTIRLAWQPYWAIQIFRWLSELKPWGMLEVFMLGLLVAVVKLGDIAVLVMGSAFWAFIFLVLSMAALTANLDRFTVWRALKACPNSV
ncbi:paraquat-inducible protein A [uncultured Thiothrix sp.]|uniref:paraquat-inducible protein A n=1 Tax=uncultured Thiothrix sp. TaxID=223185 RepID=UPI00261E8827|nr:paraquat-inducible protein A [uncultured Thiothrix sp.]